MMLFLPTKCGILFLPVKNDDGTMIGIKQGLLQKASNIDMILTMRILSVMFLKLLQSDLFSPSLSLEAGAYDD
jgi:hypothetical protein